MTRIALLWLALVSGLAQAQGDDQKGCSNDIEHALRTIHPKAVIQGEVSARHCKPWPPAEGRQTAAVMAFEQPAKTNDGRTWTVVVALVDDKTNRVLNSHTGEVGEDAVTSVDPGSFTLDTARYQVGPKLRALGVRFSSGGRPPSAADSLSGNELTLLVPEGRDLRPVFTRPMWAQEADVCCLSGQFPGALWRSAEMTVAIGPATAQGWNDLVITETTVHDGNPPAKFDPTPHKRRFIYRYDGKAYRRATDPAPFWDRNGNDSSTVAW